MALPSPPSLRGAPPPFSRPLLSLLLVLTSSVLRRSVLRLLLAGGAAEGVGVRGGGVVEVVEVAVAVGMAGVVEVAVTVGVVGVVEGVRVLQVEDRGWVAVEVELTGVEA
ncbi:unnamed protein product [Closterium sp. NIES-54]